jgi:hypothetical protein
MTDITALLPPDKGLSDEAIQTCNDSLSWSVWALGLATEIATFPVDDLAREMAADPDYAAQVIEVYKMMAVERVESPIRERIAEEIFTRLRNALRQANHLPAGNPLKLTIDYTKVAPCYGLHPDDINCLRPDLR